MTKKTVADNATTIVNTSIATDATGAPEEALKDDDQRWLETVLASLNGRSREAQEALKKALEDGHTNGAGPLLGLELSNTENKQEIQTKREDSNPSAMLSPLLGTSFSYDDENADESSERRSSSSICSNSLLHRGSAQSSNSPHKRVDDRTADCYLA